MTVYCCGGVVFVVVSCFVGLLLLSPCDCIGVVVLMVCCSGGVLLLLLLGRCCRC